MIRCNQCGKRLDEAGIRFCPYCGAKLAVEQRTEPRSAVAEKWIRRAMAVTSYPERKKVLLKGLEECPDSAEIEWELLFIGEEPPRRSRMMDYFVIKCWVMEIYRNPGNLSAEQRDRMRQQLFDAPELVRCIRRAENPAEKQQEYLLRLCREYIEIFLEGNSRVMGTLFGIQLERNREKKLAGPVAEMLGRIRQDEQLSAERREQLRKAMIQAYSDRTNGKTEYLNALL